ncbi:CbtB domain-containing protein [Pseudoxanthobacter sp. M-2]|uniref:CbtB domain-containing protein n=1 Tax=Pseudoxanthobacter sp. M-2 TaxID=3078754 RepID=UPI0038FCE4E0
MTEFSKELAATRPQARSEALIAAAIAFAIGAFMVFGVGFAHSDALHNAAHDTRHTLAFPCH